MASTNSQGGTPRRCPACGRALRRVCPECRTSWLDGIEHCAGARFCSPHRTESAPRGQRA
ncbi:hypothetical protein N8J89_12745 [Crossiella sp. CA-258035]|uniref:hypothetical protein n=1 Tax=Crossiella sp. CA-258035 TaxID=2981138 RepID=UPI0024BBFAAF|nr:hypothetical protein [Crossiella sp. CA-258035]WHT21888.1 hypothetical protein N8J89_12745 [Crossiella sp. CA-258035]